MPDLQKMVGKGTLRKVFICLRPLPSKVFVWGGLAPFEGSESGQKQSVKFLQNMVSNTTQQPPPSHPLPATHCLYILYFDFKKGGGAGEENQREG